MTLEEHIAESRDSEITAARLYSEGRPLQGAEITWCSVKHAINAIGIQRGLRFGTYRQKERIVEILEESGHGNLVDFLRLTRRLHTDSDHGYLDADQIAECREASARLTRRLLEIAESHGDSRATG